VLSDGAYCQTCPADENWINLGKGGSAGLYIVVMALSWWIRVLGSHDEASLAWNVVKDVCWVLQQVRNKYKVAQKGKRARDDTETAGSNKK